MEWNFNFVIGIQLLVNRQSDRIVFLKLSIDGQLFRSLKFVCIFFCLLLESVISRFVNFFLCRLLFFSIPPVNQCSPYSIFFAILIVFVWIFVSFLLWLFLRLLDLLNLFRVPILWHFGEKRIIGKLSSLCFENGGVYVYVRIFTIDSTNQIYLSPVHNIKL